MNELMTIQNVKGYMKDGVAYLNLEDVARGLGFTDNSKGVQYVRWNTVRGYLAEFGFSQEVAKDGFIPENIFYRLAMKAKNEIAEKFQILVADEILPSIRKHGGYIANQKYLSNEEILANAVLVAQNVIKEKDKLLEEQKPKVLFAEAVENSEDTILVKEMANILSQRGFEIGQNQLYQFLRDKGYLCKKPGDMYHLPTKKHQHLFRVTKRIIQNSKGSQVKNTPKITGQGQMYFIKKFNEYSEQGLTVRDLLRREIA